MNVPGTLKLMRKNRIMQVLMLVGALDTHETTALAG